MITRHALRSQRAQTRHRILLAEDNLVNQKVTMRLLEKLDYRVDVVADGMTAVAAWQTGKFDLIIMDMQMPNVDGVEANQPGRLAPTVAWRKNGNAVLEVGDEFNVARLTW